MTLRRRVPCRAFAVCVALAVTTGIRAADPAADPALDPPSAKTSAPGDSVAPPRVESDRPYWRTNLFHRVFSDQPYLLTKWWPGEARRPGFSAPLMIALIAAARSGTGSNPGADMGVSHYTSTEANTGIHTASHYFTRIGNGVPLVAALGGTYFFAHHGRDDRLAASSSLATEALADAGIWIVTLKEAFHRARPNQPNEGKFLQYGSQNAGSFPSGHAMASFSVATVFADTYADKRWVPWAAYGGASLVAASRLVLGRHFASDLVAGAVLGNSIGHMVTARSEEAGDRKRWWRQHLTPALSPDGRGIGIGFDFSR